ncbi:MAG: glutamine synthetase family protein [Ignavibacteria bacterium]|nr:glutamine synthetase family protein [Ignavibacteria bacterium]
MQNSDYYLSLSNPISKIAGKPREELIREDFLKIIEKLELERITLHFVASDGRLRQIQLPIQSRYQVESLLANGERVDGSSLFKGFVKVGKSDLYVVPVYKTAFINPFDSKSLNFMCRFFDKDGELASFTPDNILAKAHRLLVQRTGFDIKALGELEFYIIYTNANKIYMQSKQDGYHSSPPFAKTTPILNEISSSIARITSSVKYSHNEVGYIESFNSELPELNGKTGEQVEIEFNLADIEDMASYIVLSSWVIRNVAYKNNMIATFFPKVDIGHAGNGLHFHLALLKDGKNVLIDSEGNLSDDALKLIGGLCHYAPSLTAFGNTVAASYFRLVPGQEAPTKVCWSQFDRSALIRVPLGWSKVSNLASKVNPQQKSDFRFIDSPQTIEFRSPDGSAFVYLLLAGITLAVEWGLTNAQRAINIAKLYNVSDGTPSSLEQELEVLGTSCVESAEKLLRHRQHYEREGVFPPEVIDYYAKLLLSENDKDLNQRLISMPEEERIIESRRIMHRNLYKC